MSSTNYLFLELSTVILFGLMLRHAWQRGRQLVLELVSAAIYGLLLEWGNILLFGTYTYSRGFFLTLGPIPIVIALCWAMIIYGAMAYSNQLGLPFWAAPFADALWVILLDLAFDAVAIRLQFWTWTIPLNDGFYGVPASNFHGWLYVAFGFSVWTRFVRTRRKGRTPLQIAAPVVAYIPLVAAILFLDLLVLLLYPQHMTGDQGMEVFAATVLVFALIAGHAVWRGKLRPQPGIDLVPTIARWAMHGYFGVWLIAWLLWPSTRLPGMDAPIMLLVVAIAAAVTELLMLVPVSYERLTLHMRPVDNRTNPPLTTAEQDYAS